MNERNELIKFREHNFWLLNVKPERLTVRRSNDGGLPECINNNVYAMVDGWLTHTYEITEYVSFVSFIFVLAIAFNLYLFSFISFRAHVEDDDDDLVSSAR